MWLFQLIYKDVTYPVSEPVGWDAVTFSLKRSESLALAELEFVDSLEFWDDGAEVLRTAYNEQGIDAEVAILISNEDCTFSYAGQIFFPVYSETDFCSDDCSGGSVKVGIRQSNFSEKFKNRMETTVSLDSSVSMDNTPLSVIPSKTLQMHSKEILFQGGYKLNEAVKQFELTNTNAGGQEANEQFITVPPFQKEEIDIEGSMEPGDTVAPQPFIYAGFTYPPGVTQRIITIHEARLKFLFFYEGKRTSDVATGTGIVRRNDGQMKIRLFTKGVQNQTEREIVTLYDAAIDTNPANHPNGFLVDTEATAPVFPFNITLLPDENLMFEVYWDGESPSVGTTPNPRYDYKTTYDYDLESSFKISENSIITNSTAKVYHIHEAFAKVCEIITGQQDCFRSDFFGKMDSLPVPYVADGCGAYMAITNGLNIRNMKDKYGFLFSVDVSFKKLFDDLNAIHCLGMRIESQPIIDTVTNLATVKEYIRVEPRTYFYNTNQAPDIEPFNFVPEVERTPNLDHIYNQIEVGYSKWESEYVNGIDEFNSKRTFSTPVVNVKKKLSIMCSSITGGYLIEATRRQQFKEKPTTDFATDNDTFLICLNPQAPDQAEKNEQFEFVENLFSPSTAYNMRLSPMRMLANWWPYIAISLHKKSPKRILFQSGTGNYQMKSAGKDACDKIIGQIAENANLAERHIKDAHKPALFSPESLDYTVEMSFGDFLSLKENAIYAFGHSCGDKNHILSFIKDVKFRAERDGWFAEMSMQRKDIFVPTPDDTIDLDPIVGRDPTIPGTGSGVYTYAHFAMSEDERLLMGRRLDQQANYNFFARSDIKINGTTWINSPADGTDTLKRANDFFASPATWDYAGPQLLNSNGSVATNNGTANEPINNASGEEVFCAGFVYLCATSLADKPTKKNLIRDYILRHVRNARLDWKNATLYPNHFSVDVNPGFFIALWLYRMLYAYDCIKKDLTTPEKQEIETWFFNAGILWVRYHLNVYLDDIWFPTGFANRLARNTVSFNPSRATQLSAGTELTHVGGYVVKGIHEAHNNRRGCYALFAASLGAMLLKENNVLTLEVAATNGRTYGSSVEAEVLYMIDSAQLFFEESLKFAYFPDSTYAEFYRGTLADPELGYNYAGTMLQLQVYIWDILMRCGRKPQIENYATSDGMLGSEGGQKSLLSISQALGKYRAQLWTPTRYSNGGSSTPYIINGVSENQNYNYILHTVPVTIQNHYQNQFLEDIIYQNTSKYPLLPPIPVVPSQTGNWPAWTGAFGVNPAGIMLTHGKVWEELGYSPYFGA